MIEDKVSLARKRVELIEKLNAPLSPEKRVHLQGELSITNAKIKALNTTEAAQLKAAADRRKVSGLAEAQANSARARANAGLSIEAPDDHENEDDAPGQTAAIDSWIDAVLLRHDIEFSRDTKDRLMVTSDPRRRAPMEPSLAAAIELLVTGVYAAARGQELPDLPNTPASKPTPPKAPKAPKATPAPKSKKR